MAGDGLSGSGDRPLAGLRVFHVLVSAAGGATASALDLIRAHKKMGIESACVCAPYGTLAERDAVRNAVDGRAWFHPLYFWNRKSRVELWKRPALELLQGLSTGWACASAHFVARQVRAFGADIVHTNSLLVTEGGLAAKALGKPHLWHLRELLGPGSPFRFPLEGAALGALLQRRSALVVANSNTTASGLKNILAGECLRVIPNGIDLSAFVQRRRHRSGKKIVVGMVGSLTSRMKQHRLFVDAAASMRRMEPTLPLTFCLFGHGAEASTNSQRDAYVAAIHQRVWDEGLQSVWTWRGFVSQPAQILTEVDVLVHPAEQESFGRVAVEAMAAGVPVVGPAAGGIGEVVVDGQTGLLVPPRDSEALARACVRLCADARLRHAFGQAGKRHVRRHYSLDACATAVAEGYVYCLRRTDLPHVPRRDP